MRPKGDSASGLACSGGGKAAAYMPPSLLTLSAFKLVNRSTMSWSYCAQNIKINSRESGQSSKDQFVT